MDLLDILTGRAAKVMNGNYYPTLPETPNDIAIPFSYEPVDMVSWHYRKLFGNMTANDTASAVVKTVDPHDYRVGQYVTLQDGRLYTIASVARDNASVTNMQAYRLQANPAGIEYVLQLIEKENPWGWR